MPNPWFFSSNTSVNFIVAQRSKAQPLMARPFGDAGDLVFQGRLLDGNGLNSKDCNLLKFCWQRVNVGENCGCPFSKTQPDFLTWQQRRMEVQHCARSLSSQSSWPDVGQETWGFRTCSLCAMPLMLMIKSSSWTSRSPCETALFLRNSLGAPT